MTQRRSDKNAISRPSSPHTPGRAIHAGIWIAVIGALLVFAPLLLGRGMLNKYFVAFGFVALCLGLSIVLHGVLDFQGRRK